MAPHQGAHPVSVCGGALRGGGLLLHHGGHLRAGGPQDLLRVLRQLPLHRRAAPLQRLPHRHAVCPAPAAWAAAGAEGELGLCRAHTQQPRQERPGSKPTLCRFGDETRHRAVRAAAAVAAVGDLRLSSACMLPFTGECLRRATPRSLESHGTDRPPRSPLRLPPHRSGASAAPVQRVSRRASSNLCQALRSPSCSAGPGCYRYWGPWPVQRPHTARV